MKAREQAVEDIKRAVEAMVRAVEAIERAVEAIERAAEANSVLKRVEENYIRMRLSAEDSNAEIVDGLAQISTITQGEAQRIFDRYVATHPEDVESKLVKEY